MGKIPHSTCINQRGNVPVASLQYTLRLTTGTKLSMSGNVPKSTIFFTPRKTQMRMNLDHVTSDGETYTASSIIGLWQ